MAAASSAGSASDFVKLLRDVSDATGAAHIGAAQNALDWTNDVPCERPMGGVENFKINDRWVSTDHLCSQPAIADNIELMIVIRELLTLHENIGTSAGDIVEGPSPSSSGIKVMEVAEDVFDTSKPIPDWANLPEGTTCAKKLTWTLKDVADKALGRQRSVEVPLADAVVRSSNMSFGFIAPKVLGPETSSMVLSAWFDEDRKLIRIGTGYLTGQSNGPGCVFNPCLMLRPYFDALAAPASDENAQGVVAKFETELPKWLEKVESTGKLWALTEDFGVIAKSPA